MANDTKAPGRSCPPKPEGFLDRQMTLFQTFCCDDDERSRLSNTLELWDAIPKYAISRAQQNKMRIGGMLQPFEAIFSHRGKRYRLTLYPAQIKGQNGNMSVFFLAEREELIEDVLRKMATERGQGFLDETGPGVTFTINQIREMLTRYGHSVRYDQIIESLKVLSHAVVELSEDGSKHSFYSSSIITELAAVSREDWKKDPKAKWYVRFNSLIEQSIRARTYRQFDFARMMSHSSRIARWLYKRMAHLYLQASITDPYRISLTTIKRDSGLLNASALRHDAQNMQKALGEMRERHILVDVQEERRYGPRRTLMDVVYTLIPHPDFIRQVKLANKRTLMMFQKSGASPSLEENI